jgi:hypothetical protein
MMLIDAAISVPHYDDEEPIIAVQLLFGNDQAASSL